MRQGQGKELIFMLLSFTFTDLYHADSSNVFLHILPYHFISSHIISSPSSLPHRAMTHFTFEAERTLLGASLEAIAPVFEEAKAGSSGGGAAGGSVVLQLCFVISDARIDSDNRSRLDGVVRSFAEQNVLVVLIVIDKNLDPKDSIFNTRTVEFKGDKVVTSAYLDDFPFPYYVAIQKLEALPEVLSDALKQWFEIVGDQLSAAASSK
jgi:midasin (ATPase involved in ribosome maturation)